MITEGSNVAETRRILLVEDDCIDPFFYLRRCILKTRQLFYEPFFVNHAAVVLLLHSMSGTLARARLLGQRFGADVPNAGAG